LVVYDSDSNKRYSTEIGEFLDVAAVGEELWVMASTHLTRLRLADGRQIAMENVERMDPNGRFLISATAPLLPVWHGDEPKVIRIGSRNTTSLSSYNVHTEVPGSGGEVILPLADRRWLLWQAGQLRLWRSIGEAWRKPLGEPGSRPFDAQIVLDGRMFVLAQWRPPRPGEDGSELRLSVAAVSDGSPYVSLRLPSVSQLAIASRRGLAAVRFGNRVSVFDLRFGRWTHSLQLPDGVVEFAVDDGLQNIALRNAEWVELVRPERLVASAAEASQPVPPAPPPTTANGHSTEPEALAAVQHSAVGLDAPQPEVRGPQSNTATDNATSETPHDEEPLPNEPLVRLDPVTVSPTGSDEDIAQLTELQLQVINARLGVAIAEAWDTGRLSQADVQKLPFFEEVHGLLRVSSGRANKPLSNAVNRLSEAEKALENALTRHAVQTPLDLLVRDFQLTPLAASIVYAIAATRLHGETARLYGILTNDSGRPLVDEFVLARVLGREHAQAIGRELDGDQPLRKFGIIRMGSGERPFAGLTIDPLVVRLIARQPLDGEADPHLAVRRVDRNLEELQMPRDQLVKALRFLARPTAQLAATADPSIRYADPNSSVDHVRVVVRGRTGSGRHTLITSLAARAGRNVGVIDISTIPREPSLLAATLESALRRALLRGLLPCIDGLEVIGSEQPELKLQVTAVLRSHPGPLAARLPADATIPLPPGYLLIDLPVRNEVERSESWAIALDRHHIELSDASELAARYRVGPGTIDRVCAEVARKPERPSDAAGWVRELDDAVRQHLDNRLSATAQRVTRLAKWSDVVLPEEVTDSLLELTSRVRHRKKVYEQWGFDRAITTARGITALFSGSPGTGKTMVAGVIARDLGLELYRVDVSRITSKWIGETEKNLGALFDAAEDGQVMLLFDEADSLFAKRTEVKTSVDRYANMEINYLLQRLDTFEGIAILTTNFGSAIDPAFKRRLTYRVTFPFPDEEMREQLWRSLIPREVPISGSIDYASLSQRFQLSGGYIRNAALRAAFLAAEESSPLTHDHLERAIRMEFREIGKLAESGTLE
jgi:SpoVK/Ycf46/Vps4 family AAA+-type ATPase